MGKSDHKKAWQTAQRALQAAHDAKALANQNGHLKLTWQQRARRITVFIFSTLLLGIIAFSADFSQLLGGPPWPTSLKVSPQQTSSGSPFNNPFDVSNTSGVADIYDLSIKCQIIFLEAARLRVTRDFKGELIFSARGINKVLEAGHTRQFTCPFAEYLNQQGFGASALDNPKEASIALIAEYRHSAWWPPFRSTPTTLLTRYILDTKTNPPRWTNPIM